MPSRKNQRVVIHLKTLCDKRGVTPYRVAASINREASTLHDVISGRRGISEDLLVDLCDFFDCGAGDMIEILPASAVSSLPEPLKK